MSPHASHTQVITTAYKSSIFVQRFTVLNELKFMTLLTHGRCPIIYKSKQFSAQPATVTNTEYKFVQDSIVVVKKNTILYAAYGLWTLDLFFPC